MANPDRQGQSDYRRTEQEVANKGFDETFKVPVTELLAYNSGANTLDRVQINDSGQILTNASLTGSGGDGAILDGVSSSIKASVIDYTNSNPLAVRLTDTNGDYTAAGAGTQYTEDAAAAANPIGSALNLVRDDARSGSLTSTDGDNVAARGTNSGELYVKHTDSIPATQSGTWNVTNVSGTVSLPTGASTSAKQDTGNTSLGSIDTKLATAKTADFDAGAGTDTVQIQGIALPKSGGAVAGGTGTDPLRVDPTGTTAQPITDNGGSVTVDNGGTFAVQAAVTAGATNIAKAEDVASADADVGVPAMAVRKATPANTSGTDGDYEMLQVSGGRLWTSAAIDTALPAGTNAIGKLAANDGVDVGDVTINNASGASAVNIQDGGNSITVDGTVSITANSAVNVAQMNGATVTMGNGTSGTGVQRVAIASDNTVLPGVGAGVTGSAPPANASYGGLLAQTANPTAATAGNLVGALADKLGKQVVVGSIRDLKVNQITTITASTSETTVLTAVASTFLDVYGVIVVNSSATAANISFKDATAGTTQFNVYVPAGDTRGFMLPESGAIKQGTVNNNWTATSSASVSSLVITMLAVKNT